MPGFPIRTSADQGLVDGSPQLFAVTHVLHRFLAPRHPPLALRSLIYKIGISKMLVLALQFSKGGAQLLGITRTSVMRRLRGSGTLDLASELESSWRDRPCRR